MKTHRHEYRVHQFRYEDLQLIAAVMNVALRTNAVQSCCSRILLYKTTMSACDSQQEQCDDIAIYDEQDFWQPPSKTLGCDQLVDRRKISM